MNKHVIASLSLIAFLLSACISSLSSEQPLIPASVPSDPTFLSFTYTPSPTATITTTPSATPSPVGPIKIDANPNEGFSFPYYLYIPAVVHGNNILVLPNNTGKRSDDFSVHEESARIVEMNGKIPWADQLSLPLIVPVFPRPDNETDGTIASQYLGRGTLEEEWQTKYPDLARQDLQLLAMIDNARERLGSRGIVVNDKVLLWGYSASGMFVSRFVILHPDRIKAAAFGGHGWTTVPVDRWEGLYLPYPYGIGDVEQLTNELFDLEAFCDVAIMSYMGELDDNGWAMPWYVGPKYNRAGIHQAIVARAGSSSTSLLEVTANIFESIGCPKSFVSYPNTDHQISYQMDEDVLEFFLLHND